MKNERIFLSPPHIGDEELLLVGEAFASNWVAPAGPHLNAFEKEFCQITGTAHAVALSSGTAALHLALLLSGVVGGDEVLCSTLTFVASANPIRYIGAKPVFIDIDFRSWNLDPDLLKDWLTRRAAVNRLPKAIVVVHLYGQCADLDPIEEICGRFGVVVIEDAAEALGAAYKGRSAGSSAPFGVFSFNGNKIITTSGGGMLACQDADLAEKARFLSTQARDAAPHYQHSQQGYNYRMSNVLAAIGRGQISKLHKYVAARRKNFEYYQTALSDLPGIDFMPEAEYGKSTRWLSCMKVNEQVSGVSAEKIRLSLEAENIECRPVWKPLHLQPLFAGCEAIGGNVSEELFRTGLCLPSGSALSEEQLNRVVQAIRNCF